jgi:hypothetical protein
LDLARQKIRSDSKYSAPLSAFVCMEFFSTTKTFVGAHNKALECDNKAVFSSLGHFFAYQKNAHKQKLCVVRCGGGFSFLSLLFIFAAAAAAKWK